MRPSRHEIGRRRIAAIRRCLTPDAWVTVSDIAGLLTGPDWPVDRAQRHQAIRMTLGRLLVAGGAIRERDPWTYGGPWRWRATRREAVTT